MITLQLTKVEAVLLANLLDLAADRFGNDGCSEFDAYREVGLTPAECDALHKKLWEADGGASRGDDPGSGPVFENWMLMRYFAKKLRE